VLSACNAVAADKPGAEAVSGLARFLLFGRDEEVCPRGWGLVTKSKHALLSEMTMKFKNMASPLKSGPLGLSTGDSSFPEGTANMRWK
jgi:hypothetical protein